jgi:hypothetical protein
MRLPGLARALEDRALTITGLAEEVGISWPTAYRAVMGEVITKRTAVRIAQAIDRIPIPSSLSSLRETAPEVLYDPGAEEVPGVAPAASA